MLVQVISDLHLEFQNNRDYLEANPIIPMADILILAGDICYLSKFDTPEISHFFELWKDQFKLIIYIPGNHDYYFSDYSYNFTKFKQEHDNLIILNNDFVVTKGYKFICSTLWSGISLETSKCLADYTYIKNFTHLKENYVYEFSKKYIEQQLKDSFYTNIVVTHHLPHPNLIDPYFKNSSINDGFCSNQEHILKKYDFPLWIHGHAHLFKEETIHNTLVTRNPLGYIHEFNSFKTDYVLDV